MSPSLDFHKLRTTARKFVPFLPPAPISPGGAKEQNASLLYSKLPPELRQIIWETYFHGHAVHIYRTYKALRARECLKPDDGATLGPHFGQVCGLPKGISCDHLPLLLTCKRMYVSCPAFSYPPSNRLISYFECLPTLYRETLFDFSHSPGSVRWMSKRLPATHVAHISQIHVVWEAYHPFTLTSKKPSEDDIIWVKVWDAMAAMEGLKWLTFELMLARTLVETAEFTKHEWTILEGVRKVTRPTHFVLILPFPAAASTREEMLPCTVIRRLRSQDFYQI